MIICRRLHTSFYGVVTFGVRNGWQEDNNEDGTINRVNFLNINN